VIDGAIVMVGGGGYGNKVGGNETCEPIDPAAGKGQAENEPDHPAEAAPPLTLP
jgi:hypothetical protein